MTRGHRYDLGFVVWARSQTDVRDLGDWIRDNLPPELAERVGIVGGPEVGLALDGDQVQVRAGERRFSVVA